MRLAPDYQGVQGSEYALWTMSTVEAHLGCLQYTVSSRSLAVLRHVRTVHKYGALFGPTFSDMVNFRIVPKPAKAQTQMTVSAGAKWGRNF